MARTTNRSASVSAPPPVNPSTAAQPLVFQDSKLTVAPTYTTYEDDTYTLMVKGHSSDRVELDTHAGVQVGDEQFVGFLTETGDGDLLGVPVLELKTRKVYADVTIEEDEGESDDEDPEEEIDGDEEADTDGDSGSDNDSGEAE